MISVVIYSVRIFLMILEGIVLLYMLRGLIVFLPFGPDLEQWIITLMLPMWTPMQYLLKRSILHTLRFDLSPYILLFVLMYLQELCSLLLN